MAAATPLPMPLQEAIDKFVAWGVQRMQTEQDDTKITAPLYHYTDGRGLKGMLESGHVWFTDYRHMNDPSELTHGMDIACDVAQQLSTGADASVRSFLELFAGLFRHHNFAGRLEFYIASFSRARDDLGQWRAYADNGRGFAVGFAPRLFDIVKPRPGRLSEFLGPVRYKVDEVQARHEEALGEAVEIFSDAVDANAGLVGNKAILDQFIDEFVREIIAQPLIWNCLTSKHPAYEHEQELRLMIMGAQKALAPHVTTRLRGSEIVPYIDHQMSLRKPHNIAEIVLGPAAHADAERTVRTMLRSLDLDPDIIEVGRSDIPYRAL